MVKNKATARLCYTLRSGLFFFSLSLSLSLSLICQCCSFWGFPWILLGLDPSKLISLHMVFYETYDLCFRRKVCGRNSLANSLSYKFPFRTHSLSGLLTNTKFFKFYFLFYFFNLWWILSYIEMKQPWVYMCSPSQNPLQPPSTPDPSRFSQCTRSERLSHASNLGWWSVSP